MLLPVNQLYDYATPVSFDGGTITYSDAWRLGWNNNDDNHMRVARYYLQIVPPSFPWFWWHVKILNPIERIVQSSLEPSLAVRTRDSLLLLQPIQFRSPSVHTDGTFDAHITQYDLPLVPATQENDMVQTITASNGVASCPWFWFTARAGMITTTTVNDTSNPTTVAWLPVDTSFARPNMSLKRITWANPQVRTVPFMSSVGDSLKYERVFRIGTYMAGDTAIAESALSASDSDFLRASINLRRSFDNSIVLVLDTALLTRSGFVSSTSIADNGLGHAVIPIADSLYITMDLTRGDSTNNFTLSHIESYDDSIQDLLPPYDSITGGGPAPKISTSQPITPDTVGLQVTVHPNPAENYTRICVLDLPGGVPASVQVVNMNGEVVATLYNATPDAELGLCLTLDCSKLPSGIYYADIQNAIMGRAVKIVVEH